MTQYITFQPAANPVPERVTRRQARQALVLAVSDGG